MAECLHRWTMTNVQFGFVVFEKCFHCNSLGTYFSLEDTPILGDKYREGHCFWSRVENAQSFRFDLRCGLCGREEKFNDLMGLMHCPGCPADCPIDRIQKDYEQERTWILVAFGFIYKEQRKPLPAQKLDILSDYFNQRRNAARSRIKILSFDLIKDLSICRGDFIHDVGMLSLEPPPERRPLFR
jgi:hypothetical protein